MFRLQPSVVPAQHICNSSRLHAEKEDLTGSKEGTHIRTGISIGSLVPPRPQQKTLELGPKRISGLHHRTSWENYTSSASNIARFKHLRDSACQLIWTYLGRNRLYRLHSCVLSNTCTSIGGIVGFHIDRNIGMICFQLRLGFEILFRRSIWIGEICRRKIFGDPIPLRGCADMTRNVFDWFRHHNNTKCWPSPANWHCWSSIVLRLCSDHFCFRLSSKLQPQALGWDNAHLGHR